MPALDLPAQAQLGSVPFTFSSGTTISSSAVNSDFSTAYSLALNRTGGTMTGTLTSQQITPSVTATYDLGVTGTRFRDLWLSRNATVGGTLGVTGTTTLGALNAVATSLTGTLTIHDLAAATDATYDIGVTGTRFRDLWLSRNAAVGGTLGVTGAATLSSTLNVTSTGTFTAGVAVGGNLTVTGTSGLTGTLTTHDIAVASTGTYDIGVTGTRFRTLYLSANADLAKVVADQNAAATPAYTFAGDTNTGLWSPGADQIGFSTGGTNRLTISTSAITSALRVDSSDYYREKSRGFGMGETQTRAYNAGDFVASGGGTLTIESGDLKTFNYSVVGDTMTLRVLVQTFSVSGTVNSFTIAIPGGFTAAESRVALCFILDNNIYTYGIATVTSGGGVITIQNITAATVAAFTAATNTSQLDLGISFKVS